MSKSVLFFVLFIHVIITLSQNIVIATQDPGKGVAKYSSFTECMMWKYDWCNQVLLCKIKNNDPIDERDKSLNTL